MVNPLKKLAKIREFAGRDITNAAGSPLSRWAVSRGVTCSQALMGGDVLYTINGQAQGIPWRMEIGKSSREYLPGLEIKARMETQTSAQFGVVIMNRALKQQLERHAFSLYTDSLQTTLDPQLTDEMRWLAVYPETGWSRLPMAFWDRYSVLTDDRRGAAQWVDEGVYKALLECRLEVPVEGGGVAEMPLILSAQRGRILIRTGYDTQAPRSLDPLIRLLAEAARTTLELGGSTGETSAPDSRLPSR